MLREVGNRDRAAEEEFVPRPTLPGHATGHAAVRDREVRTAATCGVPIRRGLNRAPSDCDGGRDDDARARSGVAAAQPLGPLRPSVSVGLIPDNPRPRQLLGTRRTHAPLIAWSCRVEGECRSGRICAGWRI